MIYVDNRQKKLEVNDNLIEKLTKVIEFALKDEEVDLKCEISLVFVDNEEIRKINNDTRGINKETDVLSFPMLEYKNKKYLRKCIKIISFRKLILMVKNLYLGI